MADPTLTVTVKPRKDDDGDEILLAGFLGDDTWAKLSAVKTVATHVTVDFEKVTGINSAGVRPWVLFIRPFAKDRLVRFECCPPSIVQQINMIASFSANCRVCSVLVPVECEHCSASRLVKVVEAEMTDDAAQTARLAGACAQCGQALRPLVDLKDYFAFARSRDG